jgi:hypothetical protein
MPIRYLTEHGVSPGNSPLRHGSVASRHREASSKAPTMEVWNAMSPNGDARLPRQFSPIEPILTSCRVDFAPEHEHPRPLRVAMATVLAVSGSLLADVVLVRLGTTIFPSTRGYAHFRFHDYAKLTIVGVLIACVAWPIVSRISSSPRWIFFRMAILVTLVLWLPDLYILIKGEASRAVAVLMVMHVAIALVTYNVLVHIAATRRIRE